MIYEKLSDSQFCQQLPKLECHAHLNGSIPDYCYHQLLQRKVREGIDNIGPLPDFKPQDEVTAFREFFPIFSQIIYRLTDNVDALRYATSCVLDYFRASGCMYLELRTTPREVELTEMTYGGYLDAVVDAFEAFDKEHGKEMRARLIVSVNWTHSQREASSIVREAIARKRQSGVGWVVGVDICGDPSTSDTTQLKEAIRAAKASGLGLTLHYAETQLSEQLLKAHLELQPDRLGHATYMTPGIQQIVKAKRIPIEMCITSNMVAKTVTSLAGHHVQWALEHRVPILICTDDVLIFRNSPAGECALVLSLLRGGRTMLADIVREGILVTFGDAEDRAWMRETLDSWLS